MKTKKENAPILEQIIAKLEKERKKEISIKKIGMFSYVVLLLAWSIYFGNLLYLSCILQEGRLNLWVQNSFQIVLFLTAMALFGSYLRNKNATKKTEKLISAIKELKKYLQEEVPPFAEIISGEILRISRIMEILFQKNNDLIIFRERFHKEISSLSEEQKEKYLKKLYELEGFFTYL